MTRDRMLHVMSFTAACVSITASGAVSVAIIVAVIHFVAKFW